MRKKVWLVSGGLLISLFLLGNQNKKILAEEACPSECDHGCHFCQATGFGFCNMLSDHCESGYTANCSTLPADCGYNSTVCCFLPTSTPTPSPIPTPTVEDHCRGNCEHGCYLCGASGFQFCNFLADHCESGYTVPPEEDCHTLPADCNHNTIVCCNSRLPAPTPTSPATPPEGTCERDGVKGIETALGCILVETPENFVGSILRVTIALGGAIAFFLILFGAFQILTSTGNPERIQAGKELITAAIAGLLLIIFAVFILRLIGVEILSLPDF